ncbi:MAG: HAD family phosphatase [Lachnospiraceae bacterium]|nr:HAD family phosphatase [Lachnospiraceae bacterium]
MIKNIVFDMGSVLTIYNAREYIYSYVDNEEDFRWIKNHLCSSVEWLQMDRGTITDNEAIASVCKRLPPHLHDTAERFIREYRMIQPPNPPMERLVAELSQNGYDLYLLSNTSHRFRIFSKYIKSIDYMKGIWISCEHGLLKPEPEAYRDFFRTFALNPRQCFFIDDKPANIEAARNLGMDGCVYYGDVAELRYFLREKGINVEKQQDSNP